MKSFKLATLIIFIIPCFIIGIQAKTMANDEIFSQDFTIQVPKNSPTVFMLKNKFILIAPSKLPEEYLNIFNNWQKVLSKHNQDVFDINNIPIPNLHKQQWERLSKLLPNMDYTKKLRNINGFFNNIPSQEDLLTYKEKEYWATPHEFLTRNAGDCEDYAIAKYFALQYFDWPLSDLWIVFLKDTINDSMHVVLASYFKGKGFILDNLSKPAQLLIPEAQYASQVKVIALLNQKGIWLPIRAK